MIDDFARILVEPKNSIAKQFCALCEMDGVELEFTDDAIRKIAEIAHERKTGARGIRSIVEDILNPHMFVLPDRTDISKLIVTLNNDIIEVIEVKKE